MIDTETRELAKAYSDFLYFLDYCYIEDPTSERIIKFQKWDYLVELARLLQAKNNLVILKSKKIGITTLLSLYSLWRALRSERFRCLTISSGQKQSAMILGMCKTAYQRLPESWVANIKLAADSGEEFGFIHGSNIFALPSTKKAGLGETAALVIIDEWDFHEYPEEDFASTKPTIAAGGQVVGISTSDRSLPNSLFKNIYKSGHIPDSWLKKYISSDKTGQNSFKSIFLPAFIRPDRDEGWFDREKKDYESAGILHKYEENYPMTEADALSPISARSFFDKEVIKNLWEGCADPIETRDNGVIKLFSRWRPGVSYVAGMDISQGVGGDAQCLIIAGKQGLNGEVAAIVHSNVISPDNMADIAYRLCEEYKFPLLAVENNSIGKSAIDALKNLRYPKLYYSDDKMEKPGVYTSGQKGYRFNKDSMLTDLSISLRTGELVTRHRETVEQLMKMQWSSSGRLESSGHDDMVMSLAITNQMLKDARPIVKKDRVPLVETAYKRGMYA